MDSSARPEERQSNVRIGPYTVDGASGFSGNVRRCRVMSIRPVASLVVVLLVTAACSSTSEDSTTTEGVAATTTTAPATTTTFAPTTTESVSTTTTTAAPQQPILHVAGSTIVYSATGEVIVQGWVDGPATVSVGSTDATTYENPDGRTDFSVELAMDVGTTDVQIVATGPDGATTSQAVTIVTDPTLVRQFAFITAVDPESNTLEVDYAEWFVGDEAAAAAIADGEGSDDGTYDLDFYIRNENDLLRTLDVAQATEAILIVCYPDADGPCVTTESVSLVTFGNLMSDPESALETQGWYWYGAGVSPYWLTIADDVVIQIEEQYLP